MKKARLPPIGFLSYARQDDNLSGQKLSRLRQLIKAELQLQYGRETVKLFQDVSTIRHGAAWERETLRALNESTFLVPIITPNFIQSKWCCREVRIFLERERELVDRYRGLPPDRCIFPIDYRRIRDSEAFDPEALAALRTRQWWEFQELRDKDPEGETVSRAIERFADSIYELLAIDVQPPLTPAEAARRKAEAEAERKRAAARKRSIASEARRKEQEEERSRTAALAEAEAARARAKEARAKETAERRQRELEEERRRAAARAEAEAQRARHWAKARARNEAKRKLRTERWRRRREAVTAWFGRPPPVILPLLLIFAIAVATLALVSRPATDDGAIPDWLIGVWYVNGDCYDPYEISDASGALRILYRNTAANRVVYADRASSNWVATDREVFNLLDDGTVQVRVNQVEERRLKRACDRWRP